MWEDGPGGIPKSRTFIVAGSALELLIVLSNNIVQSVSLAFPESPEIVTKHADKAGKLLLDDLRLVPGQSPLTKRLDKFAANFERLATLDKLSINPGLNLYEAVAGIYESLERLHRWDLRKVREDASLNGKSDEFLESMVLCTRNGVPIMNGRGRVGLSLDYWKEKRLVPVADARVSGYVAEKEKTWGILIGCSPLKETVIPPVRISDKWISVDVEKPSIPDSLLLRPALDWLEPESTILQNVDPTKTDLQADALLGPKLPEVMFLATLDPPLHVPMLVWQQICQMGGSVGAPDLMYPTLDNLMFPVAPGTQHDPSEPRTISRVKKIDFALPGQNHLSSTRTHKNTLYIYKPVYGKTLTDIPFSHPQQLINMLPFLRQYAFLQTLLDNSFRGDSDNSSKTTDPTPSTLSSTTTTNQDDFAAFMAEANKTSSADETNGDQPALPIDVTLSAHPVPRLQIVFPFRSATANVVVEIRPDGQVHVESQNVLDESNSTAPGGRQRRPEDLGKLLETAEDINRWCEFIRTRWA
jgi:hypothetical protein